eukprot:TRINITY_DN5422_c0_g1_i1.p1 TRINITY_DN5422_c0_g1~~TRINITY_DN5422_c0_g1_i1.p1  ORF type:complete len:383 (+),score=122.72 TRINITY_DN5422_c0_g1_i1:94-1149(+)
MQVDGADETCPLCCELLFKPAVLPCGHVFCKGCIGGMETHTLSGSNAKCPICRRVLPGVEDLAECHLLTCLLEAKHPAEYARRRAEHEQRIHDTEVLPIFVLDTVLPLQHMRLYIYEPRYKLMLQRALASGGKARFGMVGHDPATGTQLSQGTELVVTECLRRNGCYFVETVAKRIFTMKEKWMKDEYLCATVVWEEADGPQAEGGAPAAEPRSRLSEAAFMEKVATWEQLVVEGGWQSSSQLSETRMHLGKLPASDNDQALWLGALLNPLPAIGVASEIRPALLAASTTGERYAMALAELEVSTARLVKENSSRMGNLRRFLSRYALLRYLPLVVVICAIDLYIRWRKAE